MDQYSVSCKSEDILEVSHPNNFVSVVVPSNINNTSEHLHSGLFCLHPLFGDFTKRRILIEKFFQICLRAAYKGTTIFIAMEIRWEAAAAFPRSAFLQRIVADRADLDLFRFSQKNEGVASVKIGIMHGRKKKDQAVLSHEEEAENRQKVAKCIWLLDRLRAFLYHFRCQSSSPCPALR